METVVVSMRIPRVLRDKAKKYKINLREVLEEALIEKTKEIEIKEISKKLYNISRELGLEKLDDDEIAKLIRESRDTK